MTDRIKDKRYFYVIALRNNSNAVTDPDSNYRLSSGQVRGSNMDSALDIVLTKEGITLEKDPQWTMRVALEFYRKGQRVSVYLSPVAYDLRLLEKNNA